MESIIICISILLLLTLVGLKGEELLIMSQDMKIRLLGLKNGYLVMFARL